jgi:putative FmdB family regulatory protein
VPIYIYACPECHIQVEKIVPNAKRAVVFCPMCYRGKEETIEMERLPTAPSFTIKGYAAKNGYSFRDH